MSSARDPCQNGTGVDNQFITQTKISEIGHVKAFLQFLDQNQDSSLIFDFAVSLGWLLVTPQTAHHIWSKITLRQRLLSCALGPAETILEHIHSCALRQTRRKRRLERKVASQTQKRPAIDNESQSQNLPAQLSQDLQMGGSEIVESQYFLSESDLRERINNLNCDDILGWVFKSDDRKAGLGGFHHEFPEHPKVEAIRTIKRSLNNPKLRMLVVVEDEVDCLGFRSLSSVRFVSVDEMVGLNRSNVVCVALTTELVPKMQEKGIKPHLVLSGCGNAKTDFFPKVISQQKIIKADASTRFKDLECNCCCMVIDWGAGSIEAIMKDFLRRYRKIEYWCKDPLAWLASLAEQIARRVWSNIVRRRLIIVQEPPDSSLWTSVGCGRNKAVRMLVAKNPSERAVPSYIRCSPTTTGQSVLKFEPITNSYLGGEYSSKFNAAPKDCC